MYSEKINKISPYTYQIVKKLLIVSTANTTESVRKGHSPTLLFAHESYDILAYNLASFMKITDVLTL